jgi:hypothetical protein
MDLLLDLLIAPGLVLGCAVGVGAAVLLHWLAPDQDLVWVQALLVIGGGVVGVLLEGALTDSRSSKPR